MPAQFNVLAAVLCEEVRRDVEGSGIIIGATNRGLTIPDSEVVVPRIGFYIEAVAVDVEEVDFRLREADGDFSPLSLTLSFPYKKEALEEDAEIDFTSSEINVQLMLNQPNVTFRKSGRYVFEFKILDREWSEVRSYLFPRQFED